MYLSQMLSTVRSKSVPRCDRIRPPQLGAECVISAAFVAGLIVAALFCALGIGRCVGLSAELRAEDAPWWLVSAPLLLAGFAFVAGSRWFVLFALSYRFHRYLLRKRPELEHFPFVSILAPAYNEQENIVAAIESLVALDYPDYELLVIDDGSTDGTLALARRYQGRHGHCIVRVFHKTNGGKWSALNYGFRRSRAELVLCVDADSRLSKDALHRMVAHMANPHVAAVAGQVRVRNRSGLLTRLQAMEYIMGNGAVRMAQADSGTLLVVPGPLGLFRRTALEEVQFNLDDSASDGEGGRSGPFQPDTFAEDFDLSLSMLSLGGRIVYEPSAISHTRAPGDSMSLMSQRYRWYRGGLQVLRKFFRRGRRLPHGLNRRVLMWVASTWLLDLLLMPTLFVASIVSLLLLLSQADNLLTLVAFVVTFQTINLLAGIMFISMHRDSFLTLLCLPVYDLYQGFFINSAWLISVLDEVRGSCMRWA